jgi:hypothetical protein
MSPPPRALRPVVSHRWIILRRAASVIAVHSLVMGLVIPLVISNTALSIK